MWSQENVKKAAVIKFVP